MAGNQQPDQSGNIYVEFDYNNIILVDPNRTIDAQGRIYERLVDHENLIMFANLEAEVIPRTKLALGFTPNEFARNSMTIARMNFLRPTKNSYLGTGYYDELTGKDALQQQASNQPLQKIDILPGTNQPYFQDTVVDEQNVIDSGLLGITSINVKVSSSFIPSVQIELEDVQGKALFQLGNKSPYAAFFNLPYPQFYLTLKGYYGQAIKYQLNLEKFNARFSTSSGNYHVTLEFRGFKFNILNEILVSHLLAAPHMYSRTFDVKTQPIIANTSTTDANLQKQNSANQTKNQNNAAGNNTQTSQLLVSERGYQKIVEVYGEYKSKGLIPQDFPELTLVQLMNKLDTFEQFIANSYPAANIEPLTNIKNYRITLSTYFNKVRGQGTSWFARYLNPKAIVLKDGISVYRFKDNILGNITLENASKTNLENLITEYNKILAENPTLGVGRPEQIKLNNISYQMIAGPLDRESVDFYKTAQSFLGVAVPSKEQVRKVTEEFDAKNKPIFDNTTNKEVQKTYFVFEGQGRFTETIQKIDTEAGKKLQQFEQAITEELKSVIQETANGIGFVPTVRNIVAVLMATAEGFIRMLEDVHTNAWAVKNDDTRRLIIRDNPSSANKLENVRNVALMLNTQSDAQGLASGEQPVYPWPSFYQESTDFKNGRFQLQYLAAPSVVNFTNGLNPYIWPEVEFVEEYIKGLAQKYNPPVSQSPIDTNNTTFITNYNPIYFPSPAASYSNKVEIPFFYEIYERQIVSSYYLGFIRGNENQISQLTNLNRDTEASNIILSLGVSSPYLSYKLKNAPLTANNYPAFLQQISNDGTGKSWVRFSTDRFVTSYITTYTENPFSILKTNQIGPEPQKNLPLSPLQELVGSSSTNTPIIVDTFPFTDTTWNQVNMELGNQSTLDEVYNTNKVLTVYDPRDQISNFVNIFDYQTARPVTNFSYLDVVSPSILKTTKTEQAQNLKDYYDLSVPKNFVPTEGYTLSNSPTKGLPIRTTTSIFNTPYFLNAIQEGVDNQKNNVKNPYLKAAYLFLMSLPVATLRERYKTYNQTEQLDYIASCFNKFGAIHKVPYVWVLKLGAVWHRYKTYTNTGTDILTSVWKDWNYLKNYDPITNSPTKIYKFKRNRNASQISVVLQEETTTDINIQTGFYPKLYNDLYYFYTGEELYTNYTDNEIQSSINGGLLLYNEYDGSNITGVQQGTKTLNLSTWSAVIPSKIKNNFIDPNNCIPPDNTVENVDCFILPSFGCNLNQAAVELVLNLNTTPVTVQNLTNNQAMYNGSARFLWPASNYGYFDNSLITKPAPDSYLMKIDPTSSDISPLNLSTEYSKIEEIFSVFDAKTLDIIEKEFLSYSNAATDINYGIVKSQIGQQLVQIDAQARNFQAFMTSMMKVTPKLSAETMDNYFTNVIGNQFNNYKSLVTSIMQYDVIIRNGNPSRINRRIWESYLSYGQPQPTVIQPIPFLPYVANSLPTAGGTVTLAQSRAANLASWRQLEIEVGFSTIPNLSYSDRGSYITDFFVDNNISFTVDSITILAPLIRIYAAQKLQNTNLNAQDFRTTLTNYLNSLDGLKNRFLQEVLVLTQKELPNQSELPTPQAPAPLSGEQARLELYTVFQSLNDKWISGADYKTTTLFEDFLFLDRASRNIGDTVILDIFGVKNMINQNALNENMSVFTLISGLLIQNNFTVMPLPAYVNFYNVQDVEGLTVNSPQGSLEFADQLWGTFNVVDYRRATPKFVCFFVGKPSEHVQLPSTETGYGDDSFDLRRVSEVPLIEDLGGKTARDYVLSNKCVGFNVDMGIRNQGVFSQINVSQDNGMATSESILALLDMINLNKTRNTGTQNVSLYNFYKKRSYGAEITALGNAMIQPMMYFNLRHVPMFNGPYMITEVSHNVSPGNFTTTFRGTRQSIYDLPSIENYLQKINANLISKIEAVVLQQKEATRNSSVTELTKTTQLIKNANDNSPATEYSCNQNLNEAYANWQSINATQQQTTTTPKEFADKLKEKLPNDPLLQLMIYMISYVRAFANSGDSNGNFKAFGHNLGNITLDFNYAGPTQYFVQGFYSCMNLTTVKERKSLPIALFQSLDSYVEFMAAILTPNKARASGGMVRYYVCYFPQSYISEEFFDKFRKFYAEQFGPIFTQAEQSANSLGIKSNLEIFDPTIPPGINNQNTTAPAPPVCPITLITSFSPTSGKEGDIITLIGEALQFVRSVKVAGSQVDIRTLQFINNEKIKFSVPPRTGPLPVAGPIQITSSSTPNPVTSTTNFTYTA